MKDRKTVDGPLRGALAMAATEFVEEHGIEALSPTIISEQLKVDMYIIERLCTDREGLLAVAAKRATAELRTAVLDAIEEAGPNRVDRLRMGARAYVRFAMGHPNVYRLIFEPQFQDPSHSQELRDAHGRLVDAINEGIFRSRKPTAETFARSLCMMLHGLAHLAMHGRVGTEEEAERKAEQMSVALLS